MPEYIGTVHADMVRKYLDHGKRRYKDPVMIFSLNQKGFIVPFYMYLNLYF